MSFCLILKKFNIDACHKALLVICMIVCLMTGSAAAQTKSAAQSPNFPTIELWPGGAPGATGTTAEDRPAIMPFLPAENRRNGAAVLVCPGGAFTTRAIDHEGIL